MSQTEAVGLGRSSPPCLAGRGDERREREPQEAGGAILNEANSQEKRKGKESKGTIFGNCNENQKTNLFFGFIFSEAFDDFVSP